MRKNRAISLGKPHGHEYKGRESTRAKFQSFAREPPPLIHFGLIQGAACSRARTVGVSLARKRHVLTEHDIDPVFNALPIGARYLYQNLTKYMDRRGVTLGSPRNVHSAIFKTDDKTTVAAVRKWLDSLCRCGRLISFQHMGVDYLVAPHFHLEQKIYADEFITFNIPAEVIPGLNPSYTHGKTRVKSPSPSPSTSTSTSPSPPRSAPAGDSAAAFGDKSGYGEKAAEVAATLQISRKRRTLAELLAEARKFGGDVDKASQECDNQPAKCEAGPAEGTDGLHNSEEKLTPPLVAVRLWIFPTIDEAREFIKKNDSVGPFEVSQRESDGRWEIRNATSDKK